MLRSKTEELQILAFAPLIVGLYLRVRYNFGILTENKREPKLLL